MSKHSHAKSTVQHGRGEIRDNALHALVTSPLFKTRIVKAKKGKGAYQRLKRGQKFDDSALFFAHTITLQAQVQANVWFILNPLRG